MFHKYPKFWQEKISIISIILLPFSIIFSFLGIIRWIIIRLFFRQKLSIPAIAIGNITVGGTGKTPMVSYLSKFFTDKGIKNCIISKGYKASCKENILVDCSRHDAGYVGDEALMLAAEGINVIVCKSKKYLDRLLELGGFQLVIFDDALQNPTFYHDIRILMIDGTRGFGNGRVIPAGPLRSNVKMLNKADYAVIVGKDKFDSRTDVAKFAGGVYSSELTHTEKFDKLERYFAFCAIGNPEKFIESLKNQLNLNIIETKCFGDHYQYSYDDVSGMKEYAKRNNLKLITTEKDYIKINKEQRQDIDVARIIISIDKNLEIQIYEKIKNLLSI